MLVAVKRGVRLTSRSRPLTPADLNRFDYIIGMDPTNIRAILRAAGHWAEHDKQLPNLEEVCSGSKVACGCFPESGTRMLSLFSRNSMLPLTGWAGSPAAQAADTVLQ